MLRFGAFVPPGELNAAAGLTCCGSDDCGNCGAETGDEAGNVDDAIGAPVGMRPSGKRAPGVEITGRLGLRDGAPAIGGSDVIAGGTEAALGMPIGARVLGSYGVSFGAGMFDVCAPGVAIRIGVGVAVGLFGLVGDVGKLGGGMLGCERAVGEFSGVGFPPGARPFAL